MARWSLDRKTGTITQKSNHYGPGSGTMPKMPRGVKMPKMPKAKMPKMPRGVKMPTGLC